MNHYGSDYFIEKKVNKLIDGREKENPEDAKDFIERLDSSTFDGFTVRPYQGYHNHYRGYRDSKIMENRNGNTIEIPLPQKSNGYYGLHYISYIYIEINKVEYEYNLDEWEKLPNVITVIAQNFKSIEDDCLQRQNEQDRKDKILKLTKDSIISWLTNTFKNSGYTYSIEESSQRVVLSVKMKNKTQLNIPVYYKNFQKVVPTLMDLIKGYEKLIDSSDLKVTLTNLKQTQEWEEGS